MQETHQKSTGKPISFSADGYLLQGFLHMPDAERPQLVVGSHGLFANADSPKQIALAEKCNACGIAFFRFHHRGCGTSEGSFEAVTSLRARHDDLLGAVAAMRSHGRFGNRLGIFGSSMGAATALSAAADCKPDAMVTVAAPIRSRPILSAARENAGKNDGLRDLPLSFYQTRLNFDLSDRLSAISKILMFHGDADAVVTIENSREIFSKVSGPKEFIVQKGGDHPMSDPDHQIDFLKKASAWFDRWLNRD